MQIERAFNPFLSNLIVPYIQVIKNLKVENGITVSDDSYEIEAAEYVRLYTANGNRDELFNNLSIYARDMLLAIQYMLNRDYQYVVLTYDKMKQLYAVSDPRYGLRRYDTTVKELYKYGVIDFKDRSKNQFWYNPKYFAAGSRLSMYPQCKVLISTRYHNTTNTVTLVD